MTSCKAIVRRATAAELETLAPGDKRPTMTAWVGEVDGTIVGFGGLAYWRGRWIAFFEVSDAGRRHKRAIVRAGRMVLSEVRRAGYRFVYAAANAHEPMARRWLESLGFQPDSKTGLHRWQA